MKKTLLEAAHDIATDLKNAGAIDAQTMHEFDVACLPPVKHYTPTQVKRMRLQNKVSQAVFAAYLNTSTSTMQDYLHWILACSKVKNYKITFLL